MSQFYRINSYDQTLRKRLENLNKREYLHDITLEVEGQYISANKYILGTRSEFFYNLIPPLAGSINVVKLEGFKAENIKNVIKLLETNEIEVENEDFAECLKKLQIFAIHQGPFYDEEEDEIEIIYEESHAEDEFELVYGEDGKVKCLKCAKKYANMVNARKHFENSHKTKSSKKIGCMICPQRFSHKEALKTHLGKAHKYPHKIKNGKLVPVFQEFIEE